MNHTASDGTWGSSGVGGRASKPRASRDGRSQYGLVGRTVAALDRLQQEHNALWRSYYKPYGWEVCDTLTYVLRQLIWMWRRQV